MAGPALGASIARGRRGALLAVTAPVAPMVARLARELPLDGYLYEPKWDGFRCLVFRDGDDVDLRSRNQRPLARYFPEVVEALLGLRERRFVLDGELVVATRAGFDFEFARTAASCGVASRAAATRDACVV